MKRLYFLIILLMISLNTHAPKAEIPPLTLEEAVILALQNDPMLASLVERQKAMQAQAIADRQLPDPFLQIGAANLPLYSFSLNQEPMTQIQVGLTQQFPRGDSLRLLGERSETMAGEENQKRQARLFSTLLEVRTAFVEVYYWQNALSILAEQGQALEELVGVIEAHYASGSGNQQDILRAKLELNLIKDKIIDTERNYENALALLQRWVGTNMPLHAVSVVPPQLPKPNPLEAIREGLLNHPMIGIKDANIDIQKIEVELAKQAYKPSWGIDLNYGARASDATGLARDDFVSLMVKFDIPIFTANRQDQRLSAARHQEAASKLERQDQLRQLSQMLENSWSNWIRSTQRLQLYSDQISVISQDTYNVTLNAYSHQVADFSLLIRARLMNFDTELQTLSLTTQNYKAQIQLLYLQGDDQ